MRWVTPAGGWIVLLLGAAMLVAAVPTAATDAPGPVSTAFSSIRSIPTPLLGEDRSDPGGPSGASGPMAEDDEPLDRHGARAASGSSGGPDLLTLLAWGAPAGLLVLGGVALTRVRTRARSGEPEADAPAPARVDAPDEGADPVAGRLGATRPEPFLEGKPPPGVDGILTVAQAHVDADDHEAAIPWFEMAIALKPRLIVSHFCLGLTLEAVGRDEEALEAFQRAADIGGLGPAPVYRQARILTRMGRSREAFERLGEALRAEPELRDDAVEDPVFERFRDHPRFLALVGRL